MEFEVAVVTDIVLDSDSEYFASVGEWNGTGTVAFKKVRGANYGATGFARPYFSNIATYPLKNELIYIFKLPTPDIQANTLQQAYYYLTPLNTWGSPQHNGIPTIFENADLPETQKRDYLQVQAGATREVSNQSSDIDLGSTFIERASTKPLRKFEGDVVLEGRLGNSIRLGTTNQLNGQALNDWSTAGTPGDPILILRNGQGDTGSVGYLPTIENINIDPSSIYLTTNQRIPFNPVSVNSYMSYKEKPLAGNTYEGNQILINSGRVFINAKSDHILLSSAKSINLNANESVNIDTTGDTIIQTGKLYLGSKSAEEPLLLGNTTKQQLQAMKDILKKILQAASRAANTGGPVESLVSSAPELLLELDSIDLDNITSNRNYTV